jgi:hypothetical protein
LGACASATAVARLAPRPSANPNLPIQRTRLS